jgi:DNA (cytosine-5)-methyltransferase 1
VRYASVCDGIGAVHVAWQPLGWECAWTSEIEPFPAEVVDHHWKLKNLGDMTALTEEMLNDCGPISLLCGGTPCQSFSVAGLRKGLADPRGNLALRFVQLVGVLRPEWVVWENVPGVLSSEGGRDFGTFLGALAELGYGFAYRVLDAQWFGVAQRRRRVFVVANARDWRRAAAVLFERESLFGNPPTRDKKGQGTSTAASLSTKGGRKDRGEASDGLVPVGFKKNMSKPDATVGLCPTLQAANYHAVAFKPSHYTRGKDGSPSDVAAPLSADADKGDQDTVIAFAQNQLGELRVSADVMGTLNQNQNASGRNTPMVATPYTKAKRAQSDQDDQSWQPGDVAPTQSCFDQGDVRATTVVAYDVHGTLATKGASETDIHSALRGRTPGQSEASTTTVVAFRDPSPTLTAKMQGSSGWAPANEDAHLVGVPQGFTHSGYSNQPAWMTGDRTDCLPASGHGDKSNQGIGVVVGLEDTAGTIRSNTRNNSHPQTECAMHVMHGMAVRRLTPVECERLQGFPDGYTDVTYRKKPAADGPRYKALGNSMAVPVMRWIGERIAQVEAMDSNGKH